MATVEEIIKICIHVEDIVDNKLATYFANETNKELFLRTFLHDEHVTFGIKLRVLAKCDTAIVSKEVYDALVQLNDIRNSVSHVNNMSSEVIDSLFKKAQELSSSIQ